MPTSTQQDDVFGTCFTTPSSTLLHNMAADVEASNAAVEDDEVVIIDEKNTCTLPTLRKECERGRLIYLLKDLASDQANDIADKADILPKTECRDRLIGIVTQLEAARTIRRIKILIEESLIGAIKTTKQQLQALQKECEAQTIGKNKPEECFQVAVLRNSAEAATTTCNMAREKMNAMRTDIDSLIKSIPKLKNHVFPLQRPARKVHKKKNTRAA